MASPRRDPAIRDLFEGAPAIAARPRHGIGLPRIAMPAAMAAIAALLWAAWITKEVLAAGSDRRPAFAAVRLAPIVEEFVQAQARAQGPEAQAAAETRAFMARLDAELRRRGRNGTTVLVAEAVVSRDVPDITADVRRAVYASAARPGAPKLPSARGTYAPGR